MKNFILSINKKYDSIPEPWHMLSLFGILGLIVLGLYCKIEEIKLFTVGMFIFLIIFRTVGFLFKQIPEIKNARRKYNETHSRNTKK